MGIYQKVGNNIRRRRKNLKLSQEELARKMGRNARYIGKAENGITRLNLVSLDEFARALDCSFIDLIE